MQGHGRLGVCILATVMYASMLFGQANSVQGSQMELILNELHQIRALLERQQSPEPPRKRAPVKFDPSGFPSIGAENAPVAIVEFTDYSCPYCRQFQIQTFSNLQRLYIDSRQVKFYVVDYPLDSHPHAALAAQAGKCTKDQGRFWDMHNLMQVATGPLNADRLIDLGAQSGAEPKQLRKCMESGKYKAAVDKGKLAANSLGIQGTPTFLIGKMDQGLVDGELVTGALPLGIFEQHIRRLLDSK